MSELNRFLINELYSLSALRDKKYQDCISTINEGDALDQKLDFTYKVVRFLSCVGTPHNGCAITWGILALADLEDKISNAIKQRSTSGFDSNPLDLELQIALDLPGEHFGAVARPWISRPSVTSEDDYIDNCVEQAKKRVLVRITVMEGIKQRVNVEDLREMSQLYADVLIVFLSVKDNY
ncbi:hypothetical protein [Pseudomonas trivialis]|uniref:hypothetical protein n=1 Tax=Pseudomonas trivialis TaxID=200450 RepID=UPI000AD4BA11|nr:hypothetical protein [Pseudomonas trivialis]